MALANVSLVDTFDTWRTRTNQVIETLNKQTEGSFGTSGTITISNTSAVALNVTASSIRVKGNTFSSNAISFVSNSGTLVITGTGRLGTTVFFDVGALSTSVDDSNTANIASASSVNSVNQIAITSYRVSNTAYSIANLAFDKANTATPKMEILDVTSDASTYYPLFSNVTTSNVSTIMVDSGDITYTPSTGTLSVSNVISSGTITAANFNSVSDLSFKEDVITITSALDTVKNMTGVGFRWKDTQQPAYGVIAQDIERVVPALVKEINNNKTVNYDGIIAFLIQAIKEMSDEIDQLKKNQ